MLNERKVLIDESDGVTYIGIASYPRPGYDEKGYRSEDDKAEPMWLIMKIEESDGSTEISYPNGDTSAKYVWDDREDLDYV